jgi:hypothetical protein
MVIGKIVFWQSVVAPFFMAAAGATKTWSIVFWLNVATPF